MDNYTELNLTQGEEIIYEAKFHWIIFISLKTFLLLTLIDFFTSEFVITNKRIILKTGLIRRKTTELSMSKIESINIDQSILGRLLGYGNVSISGTGGSKTTFKKIADPITFRKAVQHIQ